MFFSVLELLPGYARYNCASSTSLFRFGKPLSPQTPAKLVCAEGDCFVRCSTDGHDCCVAHAQCMTPAGYDPASCPVCSVWPEQVVSTPMASRRDLSALTLLCRAWTRARRSLQKEAARGIISSSLVDWKDQSLGRELGLVKIRQVSDLSSVMGDELSAPHHTLESDCNDSEVQWAFCTISGPSTSSAPNLAFKRMADTPTSQPPLKTTRRLASLPSWREELSQLRLEMKEQLSELLG